MGETAKKTLIAVLVAWLLARALRRLVGVALLAAIAAGGLSIANRHRVDVDRVRDVVRCETRALARVAEQLRESASSSAPTSRRATRRALRGLGECHAASTSTSPRRDRGARR